MFGCKLKVKEKVLIGLFVVMLSVMSFVAADYYRSLWVFFGALLVGAITLVRVMRQECLEREGKH
jgi:Flp pilus assembly protein TadB